MKRILTSTLILALSIGALQAQTTDTSRKAGRHYNKEYRMKGDEGLNLTADQKARMKALREDFKKQSEALNADKQLSAEQMKTRRKELHQAHKAQTDAVLTADQKAKIANMKAERGAKGKEGKFKPDSKNKGDKSAGAKMHGHKKGGDFAKELELTEAQKGKMKELRASYKSRFEILRKDESLTKEQKKQNFQSLMKDQRDDMKEVLTKEQIEKMKASKKEHSKSKK